jgi:hypothetical protein
VALPLSGIGVEPDVLFSTIGKLKVAIALLVVYLQAVVVPHRGLPEISPSR